MIDNVVQGIVDKHWKDLKKKKNVRYFSGTLKPKIRDGKEYPDIQSFRIYVTEKVDLDDVKFHLGKKEKLSYCAKKLFKQSTPFIYKDLIPATINNIPTDVVAIGEIKALPLTCGCTKRPVTIGCSAMNYQGTGCTLGGFGRNKKAGEEEFIGPLANNHCGARENKASKGEAYLYPSPTDGGTASDKIAELWRYVPLPFNGYTCPYRNFLNKIKKIFTKQVTGRVDICLLKLTIPESEITLKVKDIGLPKGKRRGTIGELAHKHGRTTCYTKDAKLIDNDWYGSVQYSRGVIMMGPCPLFEGDGFSAGGDSSSMILWMNDNNIAGFLFAGSETHTIGCHYDFCEEDLEVEIITEEL